MVNVNGIVQILNDETPALAFLPVVNATYLLIQTTTVPLLAGTLVMALTSSFIYLAFSSSTEYPDRKWPVLLVLVIWILGFAYSLVLLSELFVEDYVLPEVLVTASAIFVGLLISDIILDLLYEDYENNI